MIRTTVASHPARLHRAGATIAAVAGIVLLAGCAPSDDGASDAPSAGDATTDSGTGGSTDGSASGGSYADGTYTAEGSYSTPESVETISVTVTLADDVITSVDVLGNPDKSESEQYQGQFIGGISDVVVGEDIDEIAVHRVAGSSLTSGGFNQAVDAIKAEAAR